MEAGEDSPVMAFGIIADVQYADRVDGWNYTRTSKRYYRSSLEGLKRAVTCWQAVHPPPSLILQLGDFLDGFTRETPQGPHGAWETLMTVINQVGCPIYHCLGNHELYCMARHEWRGRFLLGEQQDQRFYYSFSPYPRLVFVNMDCYDISLLGPSSDENAQLALQALSKNPNDDTNSPLNLHGLDKRFVRYNGGVGPDQLEWLDGVLAQASRQGHHVVLFGHIPIHPDVSSPECLLWNYDQVLAVLARHPGTPLAYFSGHTHAFACAVDGEGVTHYVLDAPLECPPGVDAFCTVYVYESHLRIEGRGRNKQATISIPPPESKKGHKIG